MGQETLLSTQVSKARSMAVGGASSHEVLSLLKEWNLRSSAMGRRFQGLIRWNHHLCLAIEEGIYLGSPVGELLKAVYPMIRREERLRIKLQGIERQFGFQGALALVLPWAVAAITGKISLNFFCLSGLCLQVFGLAAFYWIIKFAFREPPSEQRWVFEMLTKVWMCLLSGVILWRSLGSALEQSEPSIYRDSWLHWFDFQNTGSVEFKWPEKMQLSHEVSILLWQLAKRGGPVAEALSDWMNQLDDERQFKLEEKLSLIPTKLSLGFCVFFTPAIFLIFLGALWPTLSALSM